MGLYGSLHALKPQDNKGLITRTFAFGFYGLGWTVHARAGSCSAVGLRIVKFAWGKGSPAKPQCRKLKTGVG